MAYQSKDLSALSYANGFTLWHYRTTDDATLVGGDGYFDEANRILRVGDFIFANCAEGAATTENGVFVVIGNSGETVEVADMLAFGGSTAV